MAKNSPIETRTSRMAYCSKSPLPCSANWTNCFQSISGPSIGSCAATIPHIMKFDFSDTTYRDLTRESARCDCLRHRIENVHTQRRKPGGIDLDFWQGFLSSRRLYLPKAPMRIGRTPPPIRNTGLRKRGGGWKIRMRLGPTE